MRMADMTNNNIHSKINQTYLNDLNSWCTKTQMFYLVKVSTFRCHLVLPELQSL